MMQDPAIYAVLRVVYSLSPALLASLQPEVLAHGIDKDFGLIDRVKSGTAAALGTLSPSGDGPDISGNMTAEQVETVFELFSEEIEEYLEFSLMNTFRWTLLDTSGTQH